MNVVIIGVILMLVLIFCWINVIVVMILSVIVVGLIVGFGLLEILNVFNDGFFGGVEIVLSYVMLGVFVVVILKLGLIWIFVLILLK